MLMFFSGSRFESSITPNGHNASEASDVASERSTVTGIEELSYYSRYDHDVMKKKRVAMAKMIRNSSEKVDPSNISDPPGSLTPVISGKRLNALSHTLLISYLSNRQKADGLDVSLSRLHQRGIFL